MSKGAKVLAGGELPNGNGQFYPPTVVTEVTKEMRIWKEEVFGPVRHLTFSRCHSLLTSFFTSEFRKEVMGRN